MKPGLSALQAARVQGAVAQASPAVNVPPVELAAAIPEDAEAPQATEMDALAVDLVGDLPADVAVLNVYEHPVAGKENAYAVLGGSQVGALPPQAPRGRPRRSLADLAQGQDPETSRMPSQILGVMREWSMDNRDVAKWVRKLREEVQGVRLLVIDHTGYELPWELLTLPPPAPGPPAEFLGAAVATARWQWVQDNVTFEDVVLDAGRVDVTGSVVGFVDREALAGGGPEAALLVDLGASLEARLSDLRATMCERRAGVGLLYVATHGQYAKNVLDFVMGSADDTLALALLRNEPVTLFRESRTVVFLNICHGGRLFQEHEFLASQRLRGFPEVFIGHGAKGVVATTGWVDDDYAAEVAEWVLQQLSTDDPPPLPEVLREWRERVVNELPSPATEREKLRVLTAFMYLFYGSPSTSVTIAGDDG